MDTTVKPAVAPIHLSFRVEGMTCASCVGRVEKASKPVPGAGRTGGPLRLHLPLGSPVLDHSS